MTESKTRHIRSKLVRTTYGPTMSIGCMLKIARRTMGLSQKYVAYRMGITTGELNAYEYDKKVPSAHVLIKLFMFGFDFFYPYPLGFNDLEAAATIGGKMQEDK